MAVGKETVFNPKNISLSNNYICPFDRPDDFITLSTSRGEGESNFHVSNFSLNSSEFRTILSATVYCAYYHGLMCRPIHNALIDTTKTMPGT